DLFCGGSGASTAVAELFAARETPHDVFLFLAERAIFAFVLREAFAGDFASARRRKLGLPGFWFLRAGEAHGARQRAPFELLFFAAFAELGAPTVLEFAAGLRG